MTPAFERALAESRRLHDAHRELVTAARALIDPGKGIREFDTRYKALWEQAYEVERQLHTTHREMLIQLGVWPECMDNSMGFKERR